MIWTYEALMDGFIDRHGISYPIIYTRTFSCVGRDESMYLSTRSGLATPVWAPAGLHC